MMSNFAGITENDKPTSKVLRPPGGGSSDIFGADVPQTPRTIKNHMKSNIFTNEGGNANLKNEGETPRRGQKNVDSYSRLFGEPERPITPAKNHMKSSIPFGIHAETAQQLITNGNGHHYNGKSGSVSSASSSVSSSTENLKMNGLSKTAHNYSADPHCLPIPEHKEPPPPSPGNIARDRSCEDISECDEHKTGIATGPDVGTGDIASQTMRDQSINTDNPISYSVMSPPSNLTEPLGPCPKPDRLVSRNPITGCGLNGDGVGGLKPKTPKARSDGNPVTGEGYKAAEFNAAPTINGANQVINKNRIPPGGYSSGLW